MKKIKALLLLLLLLVGCLYLGNYLFTIAEILLGIVLFYIFLKKILKTLEDDQTESENQLYYELKHNKEKLFEQIRNLVKWKEMANQDFEDTLDLINGYSEEEIMKKYR